MHAAQLECKTENSVIVEQTKKKTNKTQEIVNAVNIIDKNKSFSLRTTTGKVSETERKCI